MPYVRGFLRIVSRGDRPGRPGFGTPEHPIGPEAPEEGYPPDEGLPSEPDELPDPPPGIWPPLNVSHPIAPVPPNITPPVPPGSIWPPVDGAPSGKFWVVAGIPGVGWRYICVDPSLKPTPTK